MSKAAGATIIEALANRLARDAVVVTVGASLAEIQALDLGPRFPQGRIHAVLAEAAGLPPASRPSNRQATTAVIQEASLLQGGAELPPIDLLVLGSGIDTAAVSPLLLRLLAHLAPEGVLLCPMPADPALGLPRQAVHRFGPTRRGRLFRLGGSAVVLPPSGGQASPDGILDDLALLGAQPIQEAPYDFRVALESFADRVMHGTDALAEGIIYNVSSIDLDFDQELPNPLRIGARVYRANESVPLLEIRAIPSLPMLPINGRAGFTLRFNTTGFIPGHYRLVIDVVREGEYWFADKGHPPEQFAFQVCLLALSRDPEATAPRALGLDSQDKVAHAVIEEVLFLSDVVRVHDFLHHDIFRDIRRHGLLGPTEAEPQAAADRELLRVLNTRVVIEPHCPIPITRLMMHLRTSWKMEPVFHLRTAENRFDFLCWYVRDAGRRMAGGRVPVPREISNFLNADVFPAWSRPMRLSQLMLREWRDGPLLTRLLDPANAPDMMWWWATSIVPTHRMDPSLVPDYVIAALERVQADRTEPAILSAFARRLHAESPAHRDRYDLEDRQARVAFVFDLLINTAAEPLYRRLLGRAALAWFAAPIEAHPLSLTRMEFLMAAYAGMLGAADDEEAFAWRSTRLQHWFDETVCRPHPEFAAFSSLRQQGRETPPAATPAPRCTLVGLARSSTGLALNLTMTARALRLLGIRPTIRDLERDLAEAPSPPLPAETTPATLKRDVAIIHVNADQAPQILATAAGGGRAGTYRIGFFLWELEKLPEAHLLALEMVDEVWVPSAYLQHLYAAACDKPVINMGKGITMPDFVRPLPRALHDIDEDAFCFLLSFDFHSSVERKNPWAVVQAFQRAFPPGDSSARLLIKTTEIVPGHWGDPYDQWQRLQEAAARDLRIQIIVEAQSYEDFLGLIQSSDCVVSAHRAEGFGYLPAFGMLLGKPAIVTDYSGTQEYCTEETSYPVRWTPRPLALEEAIYAVHGACWADVDVSHLAQRMREVFEDRAGAARRVAAGRALLESEFSEAALARRYGERLRDIGILED